MMVSIVIAVAIQLSEKPQMLWDDYLVDTNKTTAVLTTHQAEYAGTLLSFDRPWEGSGCNYKSIVEDEDANGKLYRMYYNAWHPTWMPGAGTRFTPGVRICYLESRDGLTWTRPNLGICEFGGNKDNNIIVDSNTLGIGGRPAGRWDNFIVAKDVRLDCPANERYKAVGLALEWNEAAKGYNNHGLGCWLSADGIHFRFGWKMEGLDPAHQVNGDSMNVFFWDSKAAEWKFYGRNSHWVEPGLKYDREGFHGVRDVRYTTSKDFRNWQTPLKMLEYDDGLGEISFYINNIEPYFRNPDILIGLPVRYVERLDWNASFERLCGVERRRELLSMRPDSDTISRGAKNNRLGRTLTDCSFMFSRTGGHRFHRIGEAILRPGPEHELNWVYGSCYPGYHLILTPGRRGSDPEISIYTEVGHFAKKAAAELDRYVMRVDGFVSWRAGYASRSPVRLVTKPIVFRGSSFRMNFSTSARGGVSVTIRDARGRSISSCEQFGDSIGRLVDFDGKVSDFAGRPVTVEFRMSDADIYSFQFNNEK